MFVFSALSASWQLCVLLGTARLDERNAETPRRGGAERRRRNAEEYQPQMDTDEHR
jgi:hypothetical protein